MSGVALGLASTMGALHAPAPVVAGLMAMMGMGGIAGLEVGGLSTDRQAEGPADPEVALSACVVPGLMAMMGMGGIAGLELGRQQYQKMGVA